MALRVVVVPMPCHATQRHAIPVRELNSFDFPGPFGSLDYNANNTLRDRNRSSHDGINPEVEWLPVVLLSIAVRDSAR